MKAATFNTLEIYLHFNFNHSLCSWSETVRELERKKKKTLDFLREEPFVHDYQAVAVSGGNGGAKCLLRLR